VGSEIATEFAGGGLDSSMDISVDQSSPEASGAEGATGASEGLSVEPTAAPIEAEVGESLELAGSPAGSSAEGETVARSEKGGQFDIFGGQGGTGGGTTDAMKAITPLLEGMLQPGSKASLPAGMGDLARTLTPMIPGMAPLSPMIQAMASGVQTSTFTDMGPSGVMGVMAQGVPGLGDLVNVVESGLANVAGEGQGLGRGSLPEGSDTIGWIMQAVPGLAQLTSAFRGALAQQSGTGSGPTPGPATSEKSEAMTAGSQDRIMGLDVNQVVSSGIAQVGGPTTGAAAHGTSPMGRGVVDLLDTAMPGFSDFTRLVQDSQSGSVGLGHGQTQGSNQQQTGNQGMGFFQSLAQSGAVSGLRPDLVLHRTEGEGEQQGGEKKGWFDSVVDWGVNKVAEGTKMASDLTKGIPVLEQVTDAAGWIQNQSAQFTGGLLKGAGDMVGGLWNMASHIPGPAGTSMKMISNAIDVVQGNKSFGAAVNDTLNPMKSMEDDAKFWGGMGKGLFAMAEHLPGPIPFMPNPLKMAHNAYDVIAGNKTMSQALGSLNPLSSAAEDMQFWKQAGGAFLKPYTEAWKQGKYAEVLGRATFDIGSLFIGAGEVGAAGKVGEGARVLGEVGKTGEVLNTVTKVEEGVNIASKVEESGEANFGYNALTGEYVDMIKAGIIDPTKVSRCALQNAASVAGLMLTTEVMITELPEEKKEPAGGHAGHNHGMEGMY